jgi:hypothetical protein
MANEARPTLAEVLQSNYERNSPYASSGPYQTFLPPAQEGQFRQWVGANNVPFDPNRSTQDYDMRGFWNALQSGDPRAASAINPNDQQLHYPDTWKTPMHQGFSNQSIYAKDVAPQWIDEARLASPGGRILLDETRR